MVKRYELTDAQWQLVRDLLPGKASDPGRTAANNRLFVDAVLWVLRSGAHWHDLPPRYGKWKSVHTRFSRWAKNGVWERVFAVLIKDRNNEYLMLDTTLVRAHQQAATGKGGTKTRLWGAPRRIDKIHMLADALGGPCASSLRPDRAATSHRPKRSSRAPPANTSSPIAPMTAVPCARPSKRPAPSPSSHPIRRENTRTATTQRSIACATASNAASTNSSTSAAWQPDTTAEPPTSSPSFTWPVL